MIYALTSGGRLGNQLLFAANMMASSIEYGVPYCNCSFEAEEFFDSYGKSFGAYNRKYNFLERIILLYYLGCMKLFKKAPGINVIDEDPLGAIEFFKKSRHPIQFLSCWPYFDPYSLYQHQDAVRKNLRPKDVFLTQAQHWWNNCIISQYPDRKIVGVHIRQEDYKNWMGGKYYFETAVFKSKMEETSALFLNEKVTFIIFTNGNLQEKDLASDQYQLIFSDNSAIVDLILMSKCDFIIGPPSTFSGYASFMGKAPKYIMLHQDQKIESEDDFGIYMIDCMDDELDENGNKILTRYHKGIKL